MTIDEAKIAEEKRIADLQKADNWEVTTVGGLAVVLMPPNRCYKLAAVN